MVSNRILTPELNGIAAERKPLPAAAMTLDTLDTVVTVYTSLLLFTPVTVYYLLHLTEFIYR